MCVSLQRNVIVESLEEDLAKAIVQLKLVAKEYEQLLKLADAAEMDMAVRLMLASDEREEERERERERFLFFVVPA